MCHGAARPGTALPATPAHQGPAWSLPKHLTSSMVHLATVAAVMPATPGSSLQCCSQHRDRERSGWADRADMKSDWCILSEEIAGDKAQHVIQGQGREHPIQLARASGCPLNQQGVSVSKCSVWWDWGCWGRKLRQAWLCLVLMTFNHLFSNHPGAGVGGRTAHGKRGAGWNRHQASASVRCHN